MPGGAANTQPACPPGCVSVGAWSVSWALSPVSAPSSPAVGGHDWPAVRVAVAGLNEVHARFAPPGAAPHESTSRGRAEASGAAAAPTSSRRTRVTVTTPT